jgi:hypothetical protein
LRVLASGDPLANGRVQAFVAEELARGPLYASVSAPVTLVGGVIRTSPFAADAGPAVWQGAVAFDARTLTLDARGTLTAKSAPAGWPGGAPAIVLNWRGPIRAPVREIDAGPLASGVAAVVLQSELEKIEAFEADASERARQSQRRDMDRLRRAAEDAARRGAEEAERRAQQQADADRLRPQPGPAPSMGGIRPTAPVQTQ